MADATLSNEVDALLTAPDLGAAIKAEYEAEADTNAFTDAEKAKLALVAANANNYSHPNHSGDVTSAGDGATTIANNAVTNAKAADMASGTVKARISSGAGDPEDATASQIRTLLNVADGANNYSHPNHSGDVTSAGDGATTIANNAVTNAKAADMASGTVKARISSGAGDPEDASASQIRTLLNVADGANAYVLPAPGEATLGGVKRNTGSAGQFVTGIDTDGSLLRGTPSGGGDVVGPASATANAVPLFDGTTGKLLKNGVVLGGAAQLSVGTTAGTVAAGDDSRLAGVADLELWKADKASAFAWAQDVGKDWDASTGYFPIHSGAATFSDNWLAGDAFVVTTPGTVDGVAFEVGDVLVALQGAPSDTTYAANWLRIKGSSSPSGAGDVVGPSSVTDGRLAIFDGTTGKLIEQSEISETVLQTMETWISDRSGAVHWYGSASWDASGGSFPDKGELPAFPNGAAWRVTGAGTVDSVVFEVGDVLVATKSDPSTTTYAANWHRIKGAAGAAASHTHGNITNAGAIGSTTGLPIKTGSDGVLEVGAFGTGSGQFAEGNDSRFSKDLTIVTDATASITLDSSNCFPDYIRCTSGSAVTLTLAAGQSAAVGRHWIIRQAAAGVATVSANDSTPAAITRNGDPSTAGQHTEIAVILVADKVVDIVGGAA